MSVCVSVCVCVCVCVEDVCGVSVCVWGICECVDGYVDVSGYGCEYGYVGGGVSIWMWVSGWFLPK